MTIPATTSSSQPTKSLLRGWLSVRILFLAFLAGSLLCVAKATEGIPEYDLKATFLFNFARFVDWPENACPRPNEPLVIGLIGEDPFGGALDSIVKGEVVSGHPILVKRFKRKEEITGCHILYISKSENGYLAEILGQLRGRAILTVSDIERFAYLGGTVGLAMDQGKVKIQINIDRAKSVQLAISAKLLRPAIIVHDQPQSMIIPVLKFQNYAMVVRHMILHRNRSG